MKKMVLSAAVALLAITGLQAQTSFGLKAGLNVSKLTGSNFDNQKVKSLFGANGGVFASIPAGKNFSVQPELSFSMEGAQEENSNAKLKVNFINLPVMLKYRTESGFFVEAGPQVGYLASAKADGNGATIDFKDQLQSFNFSAGAGLGYQLDKSIGVGARYMFGLSDILENNTTMKSNALSVNLFYTFGK